MGKTTHRATSARTTVHSTDWSSIRRGPGTAIAWVSSATRSPSPAGRRAGGAGPRATRARVGEGAGCCAHARARATVWPGVAVEGDLDVVRTDGDVRARSRSENLPRSGPAAERGAGEGSLQLHRDRRRLLTRR